ncbi:hypothetical protein L218DRAFT_461872 [Marasmius fiardii PR-910]|nr:hypothetical protein L218DRAFT_461872 [Marasmius fiardii PR-910]
MPEEHQDWLKNTYKGDKPCKPRDDAGKKWKNTGENDEGEKGQEAEKNSDEAQQPPAKKQKKSANAASKTATGGKKSEKRKKTGRNTPKSAKTINDDTESNPLQQPSLENHQSPSTENQSQSLFPIPCEPAPFTLAPLPSDVPNLQMLVVWNLALCHVQEIISYPDFEMHLKKYLKSHFNLSAVKPIWDIIFREESGGWDMETQLCMTMSKYLDGIAPAQEDFKNFDFNDPMAVFPDEPAHVDDGFLLPDPDLLDQPALLTLDNPEPLSNQSPRLSDPQLTLQSPIPPVPSPAVTPVLEGATPEPEGAM